MRAMNSRPDPQLDSLRVPPHSIEAEQSVLGGLLLDNAAWDRIADFVSQEDFYRYDHRIIFEQMVRLINSGKPADVITVYDKRVKNLKLGVEHLWSNGADIYLDGQS